MKTFLDGSKPLVAMIQCRTAEACAEKIRRSLADGADALGVQLCNLYRSERSAEKLKMIFDACGDKPSYVTSYRGRENQGLSDAQCAELLLQALDAGATLCDIPGDLFAQNECQMTTDAAAVEQQRQLIAAIHQKGGEVLLSTHDFRELSGDEVFAAAELQARRGADVLKVVVESRNAAMLPVYIETVQKVSRELRKPFLFLDVGACSAFLRRVGPNIGTCMYLCVESYNDLDTPAQPLLKELKLIRDRMKDADCCLS